mmetsp:Transcript_41722/g.67013  ORF Transcript_41722/g.67013 Transcript_41722/m.67013 type:complete len:92 (+) Transcript_41722:1447-1722(+)
MQVHLLQGIPVQRLYASELCLPGQQLMHNRRMHCGFPGSVSRYRTERSSVLPLRRNVVLDFIFVDNHFFINVFVDKSSFINTNDTARTRCA